MLLLRRLETHSGNATALARELGQTQSTISRTLSRRHGVSMDMVRALADAEGISWESVLRDPRERAAEIARESARVPEFAIGRVLAESSSDAPLSVLDWLERMQAWARF